MFQLLLLSFSINHFSSMTHLNSKHEIDLKTKSKILLLNPKSTCVVQVPISWFFFFFFFLYITQWTSAKEKFDLDRNKISFRSCRHFGPPFAPVFPSFWMSCDVDYGTCDIRLDSSRLFYLCKCSLVVHTKCWKGAFCMDYEAKFTEVKQAR